jgi:hypothetical protein
VLLDGRGDGGLNWGLQQETGGDNRVKKNYKEVIAYSTGLVLLA